MKTRLLPALLLAPLLSLLGGCGQTVHSETLHLPGAVPAGLMVEAAPTGALEVAALRVAEPGGVVVRGRVRDFVEDQAFFTIVDHEIKPCGECGMAETCPTPWDYCCTDSTELHSNMANIEVHENGELMQFGFKETGTLDHLDYVVVTGELSRDDDGNLFVYADAIHIEPR